MNIENPLAVVITIVGFIAVVVAAFTIFQPWLLCALAKCPVSIGAIWSMRTRRVKMDQIVVAYITARKAGLNVSINEVEEIYHEDTKGFVKKIQEMISNKKASME